MCADRLRDLFAGQAVAGDLHAGAFDGGSATQDRCRRFPDAGSGLLLGAARDWRGHRERGIHAAEEGVQRCGIGQVANRQFDITVGEAVRGGRTEITHEGTHPHALPQQRVDDRAALVARRADDGYQRRVGGRCDTGVQRCSPLVEVNTTRKHKPAYYYFREGRERETG